MVIHIAIGACAMLKMSGRARRPLSLSSIVDPLIAQISTCLDCPDVIKQKSIYLAKEANGSIPTGFAATLYASDTPPEIVDGYNHIFVGQDFSHLESGDVVRITSDLNVKVLYRRSGTNFMLVTERCNSFCLMCSQPPRDIDDGYLVKEWMRAIPLMHDDGREIGITGGEPTLIGDGLFSILKQLRAFVPRSPVHILTNGRNFKDAELCEKLAKVGLADVMLGIPLYSDVPSIHDYIVQADGAFDETIRGILNLARYQVPIEIRVVVHKENASRLSALATFIGRNLQFVHQVVFMGLEPIGFTKANMGALWIDPVDYQAELVEAISILERNRVHAKIYNHQLCTLPRQLWLYASMSISDWKNEYLPECTGCEVKSQCGGFFSSSVEKHSEHISAVRK